jgi:Flp pilus assembly protein TadD
MRRVGVSARGIRMNKGLTALLRLLSFVLGGGIALLGLLISQSSYEVTYHQVTDAFIDHYISGNDDNQHTSYFDIDGSAVLFIVHEDDFSPHLDPHALGDGHVSLVYRPDESRDVDVQATSGLHLKGSGYTVIEITGLESGAAFATSEYSDHPQGYYQDDSPAGYGVMAFGGLVSLLSLFFGEFMLTATLAGALGAPIVFFLVIGIFVGSGALARDLTLAAVVGVLGGIGGVGVGVYRGIANAADARRKRPIRVREAADKQHESREVAQAKRQLDALPRPVTFADWNTRGALLSQAKRHGEALAAFDRAIALAPSGTPAASYILHNKALTLFRLQRYQDALAACDQVLQALPTNVATVRLRADVLFLLGRYADALEMYDRALAANPNDVGMLVNKSAALARLGRRAEGLQVCEQALKLDPANPIANKNRMAFRSGGAGGSGEIEFEIPEGIGEGLLEGIGSIFGSMGM